MEQFCGHVRFSIEFNSDTQTSDKKVKYFDLFATHYNFKVLLTWCKQLNLLSDSVLNELELDKTKYTSLDSLVHKPILQATKLQHRLQMLQEKIKVIDSPNIKTVLENVFTNLILSHEGLTEYLDEVEPEEHLEIYEIKMSDKLGTSDSVVPVYSMRQNNRGVLFFVNIRHFPQYKCTIRSGSQHDKFYLISLFRKFGYKIYYYEDLLLSTFWILVNCLIKSHLANTESLVFVVASHGNENDEIEFYHGESTNISDILFKFSNLNCPEMEGKPKMFLFPCCRGQLFDYGSTIQNQMQTEGKSVAQPKFSDILICYATIHGFVANRDVDFGSWYIEAFYRVLAQRAYAMDIESMLYMVTDTVQKICNACMEENKKMNPKYKISFQTPSCVRWDFNKLLYFNPGYVENV